MLLSIYAFNMYLFMFLGRIWWWRYHWLSQQWKFSFL